MTRFQAQRLMEDIGKSLSSIDYSENIYLSIKGVGSKIIKNCAYHDAENYTFIWTKDEKFLINRKSIADHVIIPHDVAMRSMI
jgi:hypothetical protein